MDLSEYPCESLTFSGVGASGETPQAAAEALAAALNAWAAANAGRRVLQFTPLRAPVAGAIGLAAVIVHTVGPELPGELAEQVAAIVEDVIEGAEPAELSDPVRRIDAV